MPVPSSHPNKKRKLAKDSAALATVQKYELQLTDAISSKSSLNALPDFIDFAEALQDAESISKAVYALYRVFVLLITTYTSMSSLDENSKVVKAWINNQLNEYVGFVCSLLKDDEKSLRISSLEILFSLQKHLSTAVAKSTSSSPQFHLAHFRKIVSALVVCRKSRRRGAQSTSDNTTDPDVRQLFLDKWLRVNDDIRWFFLREVGNLLLNPSDALVENLLSILEHVDTFPAVASELNSWGIEEFSTKPAKVELDVKIKKKKTVDVSDDEDEPEEDWRAFFNADTNDADPEPKEGKAGRLQGLSLHQSLYSLSSHRAVFSRAWLGLISAISSISDMSLRRSLIVRALNVMHRGVMPHLSRPILVMDWVGSCVDLGGTPGLLGLNTLFTLMKDYNLDYPSFYKRLYAFLDRNILHLKQRARFFRMIELFLSSTHLPATLLASFVKKLARLALSAPPAAIVMIIPFVYNVLKRHPSLMVMVHRLPDEDTDTTAEFLDPFDSSEPDPLKTRALESSMWELHSMRTHYYPAVSTLAQIFEEPFTKPSYALEDFIDSAYGTLFDTESNRKIKKEPALAMELGVRKKTCAGFFVNVEAAEPADSVDDLFSFA